VAEILVEGRKLIGSAQRIRGSDSQGRFFIQHRSIPLDDPVLRMLSIFRNAEELDLRSKMHSLETLKIYPTKTKKTLSSLLKDCFVECFQLNWTHNPGF
jgi:Lipoate-protein ligase A